MQRWNHPWVEVPGNVLDNCWKFCCHIVILVPGRSWEFLVLQGSAKVCMNEGSTIDTAEGAWDNGGA